VRLDVLEAAPEAARACPERDQLIDDESDSALVGPCGIGCLVGYKRVR
jgi:hypothetical protein